jgi:hypothetical protein
MNLGVGDALRWRTDHRLQQGRAALLPVDGKKPGRATGRVPGPWGARLDLRRRSRGANCDSSRDPRSISGPARTWKTPADAVPRRLEYAPVLVDGDKQELVLNGEIDPYLPPRQGAVALQDLQSGGDRRV